ncbi:MAG: beta-galactosidase, partial [Lachnospiraceae bacterium]|nr:beta-galactosidase [Lachnospiraceae bacterium]
PVAYADDIAAMSMVKLGSGCNLLGYYMYHGGTNPEGKLSTLQESRETGYPNDLPVLSYDFNAPVREYGQLTDTWRRIRMLSLFVHDYEDILCRTVYVAQPGNPAKPEDLASLRTALRYDPESGSGFFFVNNYQRRYRMAEHPGTELKAYLPGDPGSETVFGTEDIHDGDYFFLPMNIKCGIGAVLKTACATPLAVLHTAAEDGPDITADSVYVFYTKEGRDPRYVMEEGTFTDLRRGMQKADEDADSGSGTAYFITLTEEEALHAAKLVSGGKEHLVISSGDLVSTSADGGYALRYSVKEEAGVSFKVWPDLDQAPEGFIKADVQSDPLFVEYIAFEKLVNTASACFETDSGGTGWKISGTRCEAAQQTLLLISYAGNKAALYHNGKMAADNFYTGQQWEVDTDAVGDNDNSFSAKARIEPLYAENAVFLECDPGFENGMACRIDKVGTAAVFEVPLR